MTSLQLKAIRKMSLRNMTFQYDGAPEPTFDNITFEIPTARAVWVRSPGGRGKSTLLRLLAGLLTPQSGHYLINDEPVNEMSFEDFLPYRLAIGYSFDFGGLLNNKSVAENLILPLLYHNLLSSKEAAERVQTALELFALSGNKDLRPFAIPGSQRKLTCVLRSLIHWPQVAFLDDPLTGLKQDNVNDLIHYVEEGFAMRGLRQIFFTSEQPMLADHFKAEELLISSDWFTSRAVA